MARFRDLQRQRAVERIYERGGLTVERVQRFDDVALLADIEHWNNWSFRIMLSGTRYVRHADQSYALSPSTVFLSSPIAEPVRTSALPGTGCDMVVLRCTGYAWRRFTRQHSGFVARNPVDLDADPAAPILALRIAPPQIVQILRRLIAAGEALHPAQLEIENHCRLLLQHLGELSFNAGTRRVDRELCRRIEAAQAAIVRTLAERPSLQHVADDMSVSLRQLQRDFVAVTGLTPLRYRNLTRLSEANTLLAETSLPVAVIAQRLGYPSLANFSAAFRQAYDCSPSQVRENHDLALELR